MAHWECESKCVGLIDQNIKTTQRVEGFRTYSGFSCLRCGKKAYYFFPAEEVLSAIDHSKLPPIRYLDSNGKVCVTGQLPNEPK